MSAGFVFYCACSSISGLNQNILPVRRTAEKSQNTKWISIGAATKPWHHNKPSLSCSCLFQMISMTLVSPPLPLHSSNRIEYIFGTSSSTGTTLSCRISKSWPPWPWTGWETITACCSKTWKASPPAWSGWTARWTTWSRGVPRELAPAKRTRCWSGVPGAWRRSEEERKRKRKSGRSCSRKSLVSCGRETTSALIVYPLSGLVDKPTDYIGYCLFSPELNLALHNTRHHRPPFSAPLLSRGEKSHAAGKWGTSAPLLQVI